MRDIPKWRSQKSVWVPFIISLDLSVWEMLKADLDKDSAKELHFQLAPTTELDEDPTGTEQKSSANAEETGSFFMTGFSSMFAIALNYISLFTSLLESEEGAVIAPLQKKSLLRALCAAEGTSPDSFS